MITFKQGDLFQDQSEALVNPGELRGSHGQGTRPGIQEPVSRQLQGVQPGLLESPGAAGPDAGLQHLPTEDSPVHHQLPHQAALEGPQPHRRHPDGDTSSRRRDPQPENCISIAIPALGSGLGGLRWNEVRPIIESGLRELEEVRITVYEPVPAPSNQDTRPESRKGGSRRRSRKTG